MYFIFNDHGYQQRNKIPKCLNVATRMYNKPIRYLMLLNFETNHCSKSVPSFSLAMFALYISSYIPTAAAAAAAAPAICDQILENRPFCHI